MRVLLAALLLAPLSAWAQSSPEEDRGGARLGPFRVHPTVGLTLGYDDNVALTSGEETESSFWLLSPAIRFDGGDARSRVSATLASEFAQYSESDGPDADYEDHRFDLDWDYNPVLRHALGLGVGFNYGHDPLGTAAREGDLAMLPLEVDRYFATDLGGYYRFGAPGARGQFQVDARWHDIDYRNNEFFTRLRDRDDWLIGGQFNWRVGGRTYAVARVEHAEFDYDVATLDGEERHYFVGLQFDATAKLSGEALFGRVEKEFDDPTRASTSGTSWRVNMLYRPKTYSQVNFSTGRDTDETNGFGDYILREDVAVGWTHDWNERVSTTLDAGLANEEHRPSNREDDVRYAGASVAYEFRRWLRFGAGIRTYDRDSELPELDYRRTQVLFSTEASW